MPSCSLTARSREGRMLPLFGHVYPHRIIHIGYVRVPFVNGNVIEIITYSNGSLNISRCSGCGRHVLRLHHFFIRLVRVLCRRALPFYSRKWRLRTYMFTFPILSNFLQYMPTLKIEKNVKHYVGFL